MTEDMPLGKLRWRCRRGMKELDVLLSRYLEQEYPTASGIHRQAFRELLEAPDPVIHSYLLGHRTADGDLATLIARLGAGHGTADGDPATLTARLGARPWSTGDA